MANNSIKAAFERMWQHVVSNLNQKADKTEVDSLQNLIGDTAVATQISNAVTQITDITYQDASGDINIDRNHSDYMNSNLKITGRDIIFTDYAMDEYPIIDTLDNKSDKGHIHDSSVITYDGGGIEVRKGNETTTATNTEDALLGLVQKQNSNYVDLTQSLVGKSDTSHTHTTSDIDTLDLMLEDITVDLSTHTHSLSDDKITGVLPASKGGTGKNLNEYPDKVVLVKQTGASGNAFVDYYKYLPLDCGGTGNNLKQYPDGSILVKQTNDNAESFVDYYSYMPIQKGGTGAIDRMNAINNLISLPYNTEPTADTPAEWAKLGSFICYYSTATSVINKPSTYGTLIQTVAPGTDGKLSATTIQQTWMRQGYGYVWTRAGNATGWNGSSTVSGADAWIRLYDSTAVIPLSNGGTGSTTGLAGAPDNAMIRKAAGEDYLYYTATGNGAFYATAANGAPKFGTLPVAQGGTGSTSAYTSVSLSAGAYAQTSSEIFGGYCQYVPYLDMCFMRLYVQPNTTLNAGTEYAVASVPSTYKPGSMTALTVHSTKEATAYINSEGKIVVRPRESTGTNYAFRIAGFWFTA